MSWAVKGSGVSWDQKEPWELPRLQRAVGRACHFGGTVKMMQFYQIQAEKTKVNILKAAVCGRERAPSPSLGEAGQDISQKFYVFELKMLYS